MQDNPAKMSAYRDIYKSSFPVSESADELLTVHSIDSIVNSMLVKKYGNRATIKEQSLYS